MIGAVILTAGQRRRTENLPRIVRACSEAGCDPIVIWNNGRGRALSRGDSQ